MSALPGIAPGADCGQVFLRASGRIRRARAARGFTLIDLLITVAVVGILAAIAVPSYTAYLVRGQRAGAKAVLLQTAQAMERIYTVNGSYTDSSGNFPLPPVAIAPACVAVAPMAPGTITYCITGVNTANGFALSATPCGSTGNCPASANPSFTDPQCGVLTLDNMGNKTAAGPQTAEQCWSQ